MTPRSQKKPLSSDLEHALAGGGRDGAADAGGCPEHLIAVIARLMFGIWLHTHIRGSHPLTLSQRASHSPPSHAYMFTHTQTHMGTRSAWPTLCCAFTRQK